MISIRGASSQSVCNSMTHFCNTSDFVAYHLSAAYLTGERNKMNAIIAVSPEQSHGHLPRLQSLQYNCFDEGAAGVLPARP